METRFLRRPYWKLAFLAVLALVLVSAAAAAPAEAPLTVTADGPGRVTSSPEGIDCGPVDSCTSSFETGTAVRLTASPEEGAVFVRWMGPCSASGPVCDVDLGEGAAIVAQFASASPAPPPPPSESPPPPPPPDGTPPPPPIGSPPPPPSGLRSTLGLIDRELAKLELANIAFNAPRTLRLAETADIQLLLSPVETRAQLQDRLTAVGDRVGARIRVTNTMEARLTGSGFEIEAITPETQAVARNSVTEWRWEIEPTRTGTRRLHLTLSAIIDVDGASVPRTIRVFDQTLTIHVTWFDRLSGFVGDNWQWLWTAIVVPLALWLWATRKRWLWRLKAGPPSPTG